MGKNIYHYYKVLNRCIASIKVMDRKGKGIGFQEGANSAVTIISGLRAAKNKLIFVGNGASAAIASHQATDYWKNAGIRAIAFNDSVLLTCISNDFGYPYVFEKPVIMFADPGDILVAISSSGRSKNIIKAALAAHKLGCKVITLSGFKPGNPLSKTGELNFYVPSLVYGHVEIIHHSICHYLLSMIIDR